MPAIFDTNGMVEQAKCNPRSQIGPQVCEANVIAVWEKVSEFIQAQLNCGRGVRIPGFVTFNYKIFTTELNQKQVLVERVPYMLISEDLVKKYALKSKRPLFAFDTIDMPLNLSQITCELMLPRTAVETSIREVILAFARALVRENYVEFQFPNIGRMVIKNGEVDSYFCADFMEKYAFGQEIVKDKVCPKLP